MESYCMYYFSPFFWYNVRFVNIDACSCSSLIFLLLVHYSMQWVYHNLSILLLIPICGVFFFFLSVCLVFQSYKDYYYEYFYTWLAAQKWKSFRRIYNFWAIVNLWGMHSLLVSALFQHSYTSVHSEAKS